MNGKREQRMMRFSGICPKCGTMTKEVPLSDILSTGLRCMNPSCNWQNFETRISYSSGTDFKKSTAMNTTAKEEKRNAKSN